MKNLISYLNPLEHLGEKKYSILLAFFITTLFSVSSEFFAYYIAKDPDIVGVYAIIIPVVLIIYFAFRYGIKGGVTAVVITIVYYIYVVLTRDKSLAEKFIQGETVLGLTGIYLVLAIIIGWLKQQIDELIEKEANGRKRLQTILQQLPVGVVISDKHGVITRTNKKLEEILGVKIPKGTVAGSRMLLKTFQNGKIASPTQSPILQVLQTGKTILDREFEIERSDGKVVSIHVNASPIFNKQGALIATASIISDITVQKELEKRKDDFVNMASHELKTPVTSMLLYLDSLLIQIKKLKDAKSIKTIHSIKYQTERLKKLVSDLLDVSRLQTGRMTFSREEFQLDQLVKETVEELQGVMSESRKLTVKLKKSVQITGDKFRIYQVLTNLITNANKYSSQSSEIVVSVDLEGTKAMVSVKDFGIGIPKYELKRVFDRLYQVTGDKEKTFPGLGMGLYISKEIINRHHGKIWVESEKGKGSTFYFSLPVAK